MKILKSIWHFFHPPLEIVEFSIPEMVFKLKGANTKWHHYACNVSFWHKNLNGKKEKMTDVAVWTDGKLTVHKIIDECGGEWYKKKLSQPKGS